MQAAKAALIASLVALTACDPARTDPASTTSSGSATAASTSSAASSVASAPKASGSTSAAAAAPDASAAVQTELCVHKSEKIWTKHVSSITGLTAKKLADGHRAIGFAKGKVPHVLVINEDGTGEAQVIKVAPAEGTDLATPIPKGEGRRKLLRVTPYEVNGETARVYVDYRDTYKSGRRVVSCGPLDGDPWLRFDGIPLLKRKELTEGDERKPLPKTGIAEVRECRTFIDIPKKKTYIIGSELRVFDKDDKRTYVSSLVIDEGPKRRERHVYSVRLKGDPPKRVTDFKMPVTHQVKDGSYLLMTPYGGTLKVAFLNADLTVQGKWKSYPGFPNRSEASRDDDRYTMLVTAMTHGKGFELKGARIGPSNSLPDKLVHIETGDTHPGSEHDPMFLRDKLGRRWLAYTEGEGNKGSANLKIEAIDDHFRPLSKPFIVEHKVGAAEPKLIRLDNGDILLVWLRFVKNEGAELVGTTLSCKLPAK